MREPASAYGTTALLFPTGGYDCFSSNEGKLSKHVSKHRGDVLGLTGKSRPEARKASQRQLSFHTQSLAFPLCCPP